MKTHIAKLAGAALLAAVSLLFTSCFYMPGVSGNKARAGLVLPRSVVANPVSLALVVEGPGMDTMFASYPASTSISIDVPAGHARTFTVLLNSPSATLQGVATVDLLPGETKDITVNPTVAGTQIVVPDFKNSRIVQISDMNGTGWIAKTVADFTGITSFLPWALDFDNQGRMYIANNTPSSTDPGVIRIDDINHTSPFTQVDTTYATGIKSLAIDRTNGLIYYTTGSTTLYEKAINNIAAPATTIALSLESSIPVGPASIAVDDQGILYMAIPNHGSVALIPGYIVKYDPTAALGSRVVASSVSSSYVFSSPWGVMVKGMDVYASDSGSGKIVRFDKSLTLVDKFPGPSGNLLGMPETFLATLNRKITVIDEGIGANVDRLAAFDDMSGAGWTTFGTMGYAPSPNVFRFYNGC